MENQKLTPLKRFWLLLKPDKIEIRNIYIYAIFIGLINLSLPIGIQAIINLIQGGAVSTSWIVLIFFVVGGIALSGILQIKQLHITENLQQKVFSRAAFEFAYRIPRIKLERLHKHYAPELMNRFFDIVSVQKALPKIMIDFSSAGIQALFGLILLSLYHPFFILFSLFLIVIVMLILRITVRRGLETSLDESKRKYQIAHWLQEVAKANYTFKLAGETQLPLNEVNQKTEGYVRARESHFSVLVSQYGLMVAFKALVAFGLLLIGGLLVIEQELNIGQFVAAEIIILLVMNSIEKVMLNFDTIYDILTSLEKIAQVTDLELDSEGGIRLNNDTKGLEVNVNQVTFEYPEENKTVLNNIELDIASGERVVISGQNDSGKSTLLYLIGGLYSPTRGSIVMDSIPVNNYCPESLRSSIGGYLRDEALFEGTLLENITLGRDGATFENVRWATESLGLSKLINDLPYGYDTRVLPQGRQFSKSTIAKILIARSIVDRPRLLLLENSFSVFSEEDRKSILQFLLDHNNEWTVLLTSSQPLENLKDLKYRRVVLNKGQIIDIKNISC
ncbi:ATP-binding cassette domain-containing protein [Crocinitomicaceae bacterium]|nr:ATP-binding cassette domain-containing protein [Crocinitomicaceae bacterium]MDB3906675.1 ATP-binding cassette domain-containing protein [Crocinitomicaceae bacterium]